MIELHDIHHHYGAAGSPVLQGVSASMETGSFSAICGPSGSGKSTLLFILGALLRPERSTATIDGLDLLALPGGERSRRRARLVGFVFQDFHLLPYLTVRENVETGAIGLPPEWQPTESVEDLLGRLQLSDRRDALPSELSVGERQRVALGRALYPRPAVLLADEPTGNLDPERAESATGALAEFAADGGTVVMVTHNPLAAAAADRRWDLRDGVLAPQANGGESR